MRSTAHGWPRACGSRTTPSPLLRRDPGTASASAVVCDDGINWPRGRTDGSRTYGSPRSVGSPVTGAGAGVGGGGALGCVGPGRGRPGPSTAWRVGSPRLRRRHGDDRGRQFHLGVLPAGQRRRLVTLLFAAAEAGDTVATAVRGSARPRRSSPSWRRRCAAWTWEPLDVDIVLGGASSSHANRTLIDPLLSRLLRRGAPRRTSRSSPSPPSSGLALLGLEQLWGATHTHHGDRLARAQARARADLGPDPLVLAGPRRRGREMSTAPTHGAASASCRSPLRVGLVGTGTGRADARTGDHRCGGAEARRGLGARPRAAAASRSSRRDGVRRRRRPLADVRRGLVLGAAGRPGRPATAAARPGEHLLLEKPIALDLKLGRRPARHGPGQRRRRAGVLRPPVRPRRRSWLGPVRATAPWSAGTRVWLGSTLCDDNPFNTPWRREHGGLWDVGPHAVAGLWHTLGPVTAVTVDSGEPDLTYLVLHHVGGATSTATLTITAPDAADGFALQLWGQGGRTELPIEQVDSREALTVAVTDLVELVGSGRREHPSDVAFGYDVLQVLASAQRQLDDAARDVR